MTSKEELIDREGSLMTEASSEAVERNNGVVVEFPPNGLHPAAEDQKAPSSSLASSFVRNMEGVKIASSSSDSTTSTLDSSFVQVPAAAAAAAAAKIDADDCLSESSWSHVAFPSAGSKTNGEENKFDIVCLDDSGSYVMMCKRCTFHNPVNTKICEMCNFGGPYTTITTTTSDEQIALALQQQQEEEESSDDGGVSLIRPYDFGSISDLGSSFVYEVTSFLAKLPNVGLRALERDNLLDMASPFISAIVRDYGCRTTPKISLMYKATPSDEHTWNTIRSQGFTRTVLGSCPKFTNNVDAAFALAFVSSTTRSYLSSKQSRRRFRGFGRLSVDRSSATRALYPILEGKEEEEAYSNLCCWIVATVRFEGDGTNEQTVQAPRSGNATTWNLGHPELALPLVNFHSKLRHTDMVRVLRNGLSQIVYDHFENKTNMECVKATVRGRDFKKQKISDGGDDDQVKAFNSGDNIGGSLITHKTAE